jgi:hypothetical protein
LDIGLNVARRLIVDGVIMGWFRRQVDELKLLLFMMVGVSPPRDLQERMGLIKSAENKTEAGKEQRSDKES